MELLSTRVRRETTADHGSAEGGGFLKLLTDGSLGVAAYADMLVQLREVYASIDAWATHYRQKGILANLFDERLGRVERIEKDIRALTPDPGPVLNSTRNYVARLDTVSAQDPVLLLAHHYTRYLGDLSGGQFIGRAIGRQLSLDQSSGLSWFEFQDLGDLTEYKNSYRSGLDSMDIEDGRIIAFIEEVHHAYGFNSQILDDLLEKHSR